MIRLINISKSYRFSGIRALDRISVSFPQGSFTAVTGPSGCGKTTLLNILAGFDKPDGGMYILDDEVIRDASQLTGRAVMVFQQFHLLPYLTVWENVCLPCRLAGRRITDREVRMVLRKTGLEECVGQYPGQLSGGQQQRTAIARVMMSRARIILADEPTGALDPENGAAVIDILKDLAGQGLTVVMVTHDCQLALKADRIVEMEHGHVAGERNLVSSQTARS